MDAFVKVGGIFLIYFTVCKIASTTENVTEKMAQTAIEVAEISKPGSASAHANQQLMRDMSKAFGEGATSGSVKAFANSNSYLGSFCEDKTNRKSWFW